MALNLGSNNTTFDPYVKFNGKSGRWYIKKDEHEVEVVNPTFIADFSNIKTGWMKFVAGMAPDKVFDKSLSEPAPRPSDEHKRGFELRLFSTKSFGGVVALSGSSMHLNAAIGELYSEYEKGLNDNKGKLPVVKADGTTPQKDKHGTNYKPNFVIEKWVSRPAELGDTVTATQSVKTEAPKAAAPVAAADTESEF
jgi:hypothetical protein